MLLPPPEEVLLWLERRAAMDDHTVLKEQGMAAIPWVVAAANAAWASRKLKDKLRELLAVRLFTRNLGSFEDPTTKKSAFEMLKEGCGARLRELGVQLEELYVRLGLGTALGSDSRHLP